VETMDKGMLNKKILIVCKNLNRAKILYDRLCKFLDYRYYRFTSNKRTLYISLMGSGGEIYLCSVAQEPEKTRGFRGKIVCGWTVEEFLDKHEAEARMKEYLANSHKFPKIKGEN
jgi:hypothetical protein